MSRNGLEMGTEQGRQEALAITRLAPLELVGIMTHFAVQDKDDVRQGLSAFNEQTAWLIKAATQSELEELSGTLLVDLATVWGVAILKPW